MRVSRFFFFLGAVFLVALVIYIATTPRGKDIELIGVVSGNEVIVSPKITGRLEHLYVDEGSEVKQGQLIAVLDRAELVAQRDAAAANIHTLEAKVRQSEHLLSWTDDQTGAALRAASSTVTATRSDLEQARADLWRAQVDLDRTAALVGSGVSPAQDRDHAEATLRAAQAHVKSLEDQVKAQQANLGVAEANRKQIEVQQSDLVSVRAQLDQARWQKDQTEVQLDYTKIYAPLGGVVSVRVALQGEVVQIGAPIVTIIDVDHLWVRAPVEESYVDSIRFGDKLKVRLPSGNTLEGTVIFKGVESDFATQRDVSRTKRDIKTFAIKVAVPNPERRIFAGMTATVLLPQPAHERSWFSRATSQGN